MSVLAPPRPDAERIPDGPSQLPAPPRSRVERFWRGPRSDPAWVRPALLALLLTTAAMYLWNLGASGWANSYYSAAVQAGTKSWKAFFFGSTDSSNFITVDKIPGSLWIMELSARLFGVNAWSILVPQALEGVAAVGILFAAVKRWFSPAAALIAGGVFALTPVAALMFRFNNPDALLVLLLVCAAYAMTRALEAGRLRWILAAGALVGFGFLAKELQAFVVLPVFALVYLIAGPPKLARRFAHVIAMGLAALLAGGWWVAIVHLWPASSRPYIGGSQNNSFWNVLFGYNGFGRLTGNESGSVVGGGATGTAGQWGPTGWTRMFNTSFGGQISWLLPAALILLAGGLVLTARRARTDRARAALLLWGGWLLVTGAAFSFGQGIIHQYYTVALAPAIGAVIGIGATLLWSHRDRVVVRALLGGTIAVTGWWAYELLGRAPNWNPALRTVVLAASVVVGVIVAVAPKSRGRFGVALAVGVLAIGITAPAAYTLSTVTTPHTGAIPIAGPSSAGAFPGGAPGAHGGGASAARPAATPTAADCPSAARSPTAARFPTVARSPTPPAPLLPAAPTHAVHRTAEGSAACSTARPRVATDRPAPEEHRLSLDGRRGRCQQRGRLPTRIGPGDHGDRRLQRHRPHADARAVRAHGEGARDPLLHRRGQRRWLRLRPGRLQRLEHLEPDLAVGAEQLHREDGQRRDRLRPLGTDHRSSPVAPTDDSGRQSAPGEGGSAMDVDVATLAELLRETAEHHGAFEQRAPKHDWWDWYAPYLAAENRAALPKTRRVPPTSTWRTFATSSRPTPAGSAASLGRWSRLR